MELHEIIALKSAELKKAQDDTSQEPADKPAQMSLLDLSDGEVVDIIRPEKNLEKWQPFIFPHPKAQKLNEERIYSYPVDLPDGQTVNAQVKVTPSVGHRCATTTSYDVYLAIVSIWDNRGLPDEAFYTSLREIVLAMGLSDSGKNYKSVLKEIEVLYLTNISWVFSFSGEKNFESGRNRRILDIFDYQSMSERADKTTKTDQILRLRLQEDIRKNHLRSNTKPIVWDSRKKITSSVAKTFYAMIDPILYYRDRYERTGQGIIDDMYLTPHRYKYKSQRLVILKKIQEQVDGLLLSCLHEVNINVTLTADKKDYKIIATKGSSKKKTKTKNLPALPRMKGELDHLVELIVDAIGSSDYKNKTFQRIATYYSKSHILRAIGEFKEAKDFLADKDVVAKQKYFTAIVHRIAHDLGLEWFKDCGSDCSYRKENRLL